MNSRKTFFALIALLIVITGAGISALVFGNKYLDKQNTKLTNLKLEYQNLDTVQHSLINAKKDIAEYQDLVNTVEAIVPQEKDQARTVREIVNIAAVSGVKIDSFNFPSSTLGNAATANAATTTSQTQAVEGISGVERMEITINSTTPVSYQKFIDFLQRLEQNRRTSQVSSITISPESDNRDYIRFSLIVNVYIKKAGS